jgi:hypothetical protein
MKTQGTGNHKRPYQQPLRENSSGGTKETNQCTIDRLLPPFQIQVRPQRVELSPLLILERVTALASPTPIHQMAGNTAHVSRSQWRNLTSAFQLMLEDLIQQLAKTKGLYR